MKSYKSILAKFFFVFGALIILTITGCDGSLKTERRKEIKIKIEVPPIKVNSKVEVKVSPVNANAFKHKKEISEVLEVSNLTNINHAVFSVGVGNLDVSYNEGDSAVINAMYLVETVKESDIDMILEETELFAKVKDNKFSLDLYKRGSNLSIWEWLDEKITNYNLSVNIKISIPKNFCVFNLSTDTGNIIIEGLQGSFMLKTDTGNIFAENLYFADESTLAAETGNIYLSMNEEEPNVLEVEVYTDTGNVDIDLGDLAYVNEIKNRDSDYYMSESLVIAGKCKINLRTDTGNITII